MKGLSGVFKLSVRTGILVALALTLLAITVFIPANTGRADDEGKTVVLQPKAERFKCESGMTLEVTKYADGGIFITADSLDAKYVSREDAWKTLPRLYKEQLEGVPEPVEVDPEKLSTAELMLFDGFRCCSPSYSYGGKENYHRIWPVVHAVALIIMIWDSYGALPSGDYGLLFPWSVPTEPHEEMFWALRERQRHDIATMAFNPLRESIIRVNPSEEKSPGDIYLEPLELTDSQLAEIEPFLIRHRAAPSPAFLFTVYGSEGKPLIRGVFFIQKLNAHPAVDSQSETGSASD